MDVNSKQYSNTYAGIKSKFCQYNLALGPCRETRLIKNKTLNGQFNQSDSEKTSSINAGLNVVNSYCQTRLKSNNLKTNSKSVNFNSSNINIVLTHQEEPNATNLKTVSLANITFIKPFNKKLLSKPAKSKLILEKEMNVQLDNTNTVLQNQATKTIINFSYDNSLPSHENMKSKHIADLRKEQNVKLKGFYSLNGNLVKECLINNETRAISTGYPSSSINAELNRESSCFIRKKVETTKKSLSVSLASSHFKSKSDFNVYKCIFERPITFKNNNNREFKLSEPEYSMIERANLLTNCEKEENKILITKKKSWLIKGAVDQLYPQIMALRTNLIRKGLLKKK